MEPETLRALAADIEDVLLRFRGNPDDAETLRNVADAMLGGADRLIQLRHREERRRALIDRS